VEGKNNMSLSAIEDKLKGFEEKFNKLKGSAESGVLGEIETAIKGVKVSLQEAKSQSGEEAEVTIGSLMESVKEIEDYINGL
jgi:archaellum component FlaC